MAFIVALVVLAALKLKYFAQKDSKASWGDLASLLLLMPMSTAQKDSHFSYEARVLLESAQFLSFTKMDSQVFLVVQPLA